MTGSRTEFIHWLEDIPDQKSIGAQYCRYVGEFNTGRNVKQVTNRALQFARSHPQGPVYLTGAREVMEEIVEPKEIKQDLWEPVELAGLPESRVKEIADALVDAREPLVITGYAGPNHK
jgi:thiamine pyrophosphate-dependent acetolactate synthase large subunit-like protein